MRAQYCLKSTGAARLEINFDSLVVNRKFAVHYHGSLVWGVILASGARGRFKIPDDPTLDVCHGGQSLERDQQLVLFLVFERRQTWSPSSKRAGRCLKYYKDTEQVIILITQTFVLVSRTYYTLCPRRACPTTYYQLTSLHSHRIVHPELEAAQPASRLQGASSSRGFWTCQDI
ncbi:unnamed protein product [Chrysodeixis includens]|uniref:C2H2-type domain-containing protein n=1 Tax=Chrysodeixis includens TaxID=689277 RepID=A0A9P0E1K2_CHRIL|nr:unnamed protein product [Chrysodeixis includens]